MATMDFIRRPILDGLSLNYQARFPEGIEPPDKEVDDLKFYAKGFLYGQGLGRVMSGYLPRSILHSDTVTHNLRTRLAQYRR